MTNRDRAIEVLRSLSDGEHTDDTLIVGALINAGLLREPTKRDRVIELVAEVLAGLQVPVSMPVGRAMLGAAYDPWIELRRVLNMFGWDEPATFAEKLKEVL